METPPGATRKVVQKKVLISNFLCKLPHSTTYAGATNLGLYLKLEL